jgi:hypothetical protein
MRHGGCPGVPARAGRRPGPAGRETSSVRAVRGRPGSPRSRSPPRTPSTGQRGPPNRPRPALALQLESEPDEERLAAARSSTTLPTCSMRWMRSTVATRQPSSSCPSVVDRLTGQDSSPCKLLQTRYVLRLFCHLLMPILPICTFRWCPASRFGERVPIAADPDSSSMLRTDSAGTPLQAAGPGAC